MPRDVEPVALHDHEIERQPHRQVGANGRVHRHQRALHRLIEAARAPEHAIDDRLAVLRFADLEVTRIRRRFDEIAGGVNAEEPRRFALDLSAQRQRRTEVDAEVLERARVAPMQLAQRVAHAAGRLEQIGHRHEGGSPRAAFGAGGVDVFLEHAEHRLGDREVPRRLQHQHPIAGLLKHRGLAERADLVDARVRAGIGQEHQPRVQQHGHAIGHWSDAFETRTSTSIISRPPPRRTPRTGAASR